MHNLKQKDLPINKANVATSFQNSVVEVLSGKAINACQQYDVNQLIVAGGVASNHGLRTELKMLCTKQIKLLIPSPKLCTTMQQ